MIKNKLTKLAKYLILCIWVEKLPRELILTLSWQPKAVLKTTPKFSRDFLRTFSFCFGGSAKKLEIQLGPRFTVWAQSYSTVLSWNFLKTDSLYFLCAVEYAVKKMRFNFLYNFLLLYFIVKLMGYLNFLLNFQLWMKVIPALTLSIFCFIFSIS